MRRSTAPGAGIKVLIKLVPRLDRASALERHLTSLSASCQELSARCQDGALIMATAWSCSGRLAALWQATAHRPGTLETVMKRLPVVLGALALVAAVPARADRPVADDVGAKLAAAVAAEGCSGGRMEFDSSKYEVEGAKCNDGQTYELGFDLSYRLIYKRLLWWTR